MNEERIERRRHFRAGIEAGAIIHVAELSLRGRIVDLSLGGVKIRRVDDSAPTPAPGTAVTVELELGGWVSQAGRIHRCGGLGEIVVAFVRLAPEVAHRIEDEVLAAIEAGRRPRMIVVDPSASRRRRVADKLREAGCDSYEAATPLEAIDLMERPRSHIRGVALAEHLTQTGTEEFCEFVAETNPGIKLALIAETLADGTGETPAVGSERSPGRFDAVVPVEDDSMDECLQGFVDSVRTSG